MQGTAYIEHPNQDGYAGMPNQKDPGHGNHGRTTAKVEGMGGEKSL